MIGFSGHPNQQHFFLTSFFCVAKLNECQPMLDADLNKYKIYILSEIIIFSYLRYLIHSIQQHFEAYHNTKGLNIKKIC